jgi:hypothetical protein
VKLAALRELDAEELKGLGIDPKKVDRLSASIDKQAKSTKKMTKAEKDANKARKDTEK